MKAKEVARVVVTWERCAQCGKWYALELAEEERPFCSWSCRREWEAGVDELEDRGE